MRTYFVHFPFPFPLRVFHLLTCRVSRVSCRETASEMAGMARAMRARMMQVSAGDDVLDIVGTGGDDAGTVNISTGSCILAAAAGRAALNTGPTHFSAQPEPFCHCSGHGNHPNSSTKSA